MDLASYVRRDLPLQINEIGLKMLHPRVHCRPSLEQVEVWLQNLITSRSDGYRVKDGLLEQIMGQGGSTRWPRWRWLVIIMFGMLFLGCMAMGVYAKYTNETQCLKYQVELLELYEGSFTFTKTQNNFLNNFGLRWLMAPLPSPPTVVCHTPLHDASKWVVGV
ncbi:hypothetical protein Hamer_G023133 [Homarus americanus]|uniref:Uncharacterized protein n=1 Tax=Homarus americanus TaxID=6706 RepID=A0A8J5K205_HOMAM|nr:hypothetical protein Hamer_G023133 [Homarus americanus]